MNHTNPCNNPRRPVRRKRSVIGATFVEVSLATVIIATAIVGAMSSVTETAKVFHYFSDGPHEALMLAQEIHEAALLLPFEEVAGQNDLFGANVSTVYDLDDRIYSPPRSAQYEAISSHQFWKQSVEVRHVELDDPSQEVEDPASFAGEMLTELKIVIHEGDLEKGSFTWWMTPPENEDD